MYSEICFLHLTRPWGAVGSHIAALRDQLQVLSVREILPVEIESYYVLEEDRHSVMNQIL